MLDSALGRRAFVGSYFLYKRWLEDPFAALVRLRPGLFRGGHVLDVGANVGYTAAVFPGRWTPGARSTRSSLSGSTSGAREVVAGAAGRPGIPVRAAVGAEGEVVSGGTRTTTPITGC